jgi:hypothetical protein
VIMIKANKHPALTLKNVAPLPTGSEAKRCLLGLCQCFRELHSALRHQGCVLALVMLALAWADWNRAGG